MKDFFKPEDFSFSYGDAVSPRGVAAYANEKLNKLIESWPVVYNQDADTPIRTILWSIANLNEPSITLRGGKTSTQKARLAFIEPINKEPCKHEPQDIQIFNASGNYNFSFGAGISKCKYCGVELQATWSEKK